MTRMSFVIDFPAEESSALTDSESDTSSTPSRTTSSLARKDEPKIQEALPYNAVLEEFKLFKDVLSDLGERLGKLEEKIDAMQERGSSCNGRATSTPKHHKVVPAEVRVSKSANIKLYS